MNYIVKRDDLNIFEYDILKSLKSQSLIHTRLHNEDNKITLEYSTSDLKVFKDVIDTVNFDEDKVISIFNDYVQLLNEINDVLLSASQISFDLKDIYFDNKNKRMKFIYYPFYFENTSSFKNVVDLLLDKLNRNNFDSSLLVLLYEFVRSESEESIHKIVKFKKTNTIKEKGQIPIVRQVNEVKPIIRETKPVDVIYPNKKTKEKKDGFLSKLFSSKPKVEKSKKEINKPSINKPNAKKQVTPVNNGETVLLSSETVLLSQNTNQCSLTRTATNEIIKISSDQFSIGSGVQSDYQVNATGISRLHVKIIYVNGSYYVHDMNSTNGTFVNDKRLVKGGNQLIQSDDIIRLGNESFVFNV